MPNPPKNYAVTDLSQKGTLLLVVAGIGEFAVSAYSASFAINEIPQAQCYLAVGRLASDTSQASNIHLAKQAKQMTKAYVQFKPSGEYSLDGTRWPEDAQMIFEGYFLGFATRKVTDKFVVVANLVHWLVDMGCSSALTGSGHVANPTQLNVAAVLDTLDQSGAGQGNYISSLAPMQLADTSVGDDVWAAIKTVFCSLASKETQASGPIGECGGSGDYATNTRALAALERIEGGGDSGCPFNPVDGRTTYAVPLKLDTTIQGSRNSLQEAIARSIGEEMIESYAATTFWDKLISQFCPMFNLAVVPMVSRALVIADVPAYRDGVWKTIDQDYDSLDFSGALERPLRGVGISTQYESETMGGLEEDAGNGGESLVTVGGCFTVDSVNPGDGILQFVDSPPWLRLAYSAGYAGDTTALDDDDASRAAGADAAGKDAEDTPETFGTDFTEFYRRYAQMVYVNNMLRGRSGSFAGKLRFDIAPGSILRIRSRAENFIGENDPFAMTLIGCVSRVSYSINAESGSAATAFGLTHVRTEEPENTEDRTSTSRHPLFGQAIHGGGKHGCPLIPAYDLEPNETEDPGGLAPA